MSENIPSHIYQKLILNYTDNVRDFIRLDNFKVDTFNGVDCCLYYDGYEKYVICSSTLLKSSKVFENIFFNWHNKIWHQTRNNEIPWYVNELDRNLFLELINKKN